MKAAIFSTALGLIGTAYAAAVDTEDVGPRAMAPQVSEPTLSPYTTRTLTPGTYTFTETGLPYQVDKGGAIHFGTKTVTRTETMEAQKPGTMTMMTVVTPTAAPSPDVEVAEAKKRAEPATSKKGMRALFDMFKADAGKPYVKTVWSPVSTWVDPAGTFARTVTKQGYKETFVETRKHPLTDIAYPSRVITVTPSQKIVTVTKARRDAEKTLPPAPAHLDKRKVITVITHAYTLPDITTTEYDTIRPTPTEWI